MDSWPDRQWKSKACPMRHCTISVLLSSGSKTTLACWVETRLKSGIIYMVHHSLHISQYSPLSNSAWGESAGAGSILHQLVSFGGTQDPLFSKAVMLSPAFALMFDRKGMLEQTFNNFTALAGCAGQGVDCLRAASAATLKAANTQLNQNAVQGTFAVGPAADGKLIRQLPSLEFASGIIDENRSLLLRLTPNRELLQRHQLFDPLARL